MDYNEALEVVQQYQQDWALPGLLETLKQMQDNIEDINGREARAYRKVHCEMRKLFYKD
jgi:hypothetical protein